MPWATVGSDEHIGASYAGFRQANGLLDVGQSTQRITPGEILDLLGHAGFVRPANYDDAALSFVDESLSKRGEVLGGPMFGRAKRGTRIEADDFSILIQVIRSPDLFGCFLVVRGCVKPHSMAGIGAAGLFGQAIVVVNNGRRCDLSVAVAFGFEDIGEEFFSQIAIEADSLFATGQPGNQRGAKGIGEQHGHIGTMLAKLPSRGRPML